MLKLLLRFSRRQMIVLGVFVLVAVLATVLSFFVDETVLVVSLFWLLAAVVFLMIMFVRRLNAKITRLSRQRAVSGPVKKKPAVRSRLNSGLSLDELSARFSRDGGAGAAIPYARKLLQQKGDITGAHSVLTGVQGTDLSPDEVEFVHRIRSLKKYLDQPFQLPAHHRSHNYLPQRQKVLYAVGISPVTVTNGYTSRTRGIAQGLMSGGADVVVAPLPGKPWDKKPQSSFRVPAEKRRYVGKVHGITYVHNPGIPAWVGDLDTFFQVSADAYVREAMIQKPEYILAASNYLSALPALIAARRLGVPFVYEMRGFWEVSAASVNPDWAESDQYTFDRRFELLVAQSADHVVVITEEMRQDLIERGLDADSISVAPNSVDPVEFAPVGKDESLLRKIGFSEPQLPVVGFAGSVTDYEGLDLVVQALARLQARGEKFNFLVIGSGPYLETIQRMVKDEGLTTCTRFISGVPNHEMPVYLSSIDIFPLARKSLPVTELVSPIKPLEAMAVGGAVVLSDVSPHGVFYGEDEDRALSFRKDDVSSLETQLMRLLRSPEDRRSMGIKARRWVKDNRQWSDAASVFLRAFTGTRATDRDSADEEPLLTSYRVAFIGDTFTSETFLPELDAVVIRPDDWRERFAEQRIDALFIESAWQGNGGAWERIIGYYDDESHAPVVELIAHCRDEGIPVLFWNKEDPVHFNRFKRTAALCDYVFTTDARTIGDYNALPDHRIKAVASAPFAAQPRLHNPLPSTRPKDEAIAYGGTYYGDKYTTRKQGLDFLFYESAPYGLAIYERVHNDPKSPYRLPARFKKYARTSLSYPDMCQAYKAHPIHLNGNSVVDSPSMFSRRVVEITASGASVLSSAGRGVDETLAGTVPTVQTADEASTILETWKGSEERRHRDLWASLRHVLETHTCAHRLTYMLRTAGLLVRSPQRPRFAVECSPADVAAFEKQTLRPDLYLVTDEPRGVRASRPMVHVPDTERVGVLKDHGIQHVIRAQAKLGALGNHDVQDLVAALRFGAWRAVGKRRVPWSAGDPFVQLAALTDDLNEQVRLYDLQAYGSAVSGETVRLAPGEAFAWQVVKDDLPDAGPQMPAAAVSVPAKQRKTVLLAGHDFKFFPEVSAAIQQAGHKILVDRWSGHDIHDEDYSRRLLAEADVIFCEWALGNLKWYSHNKSAGQKLIGRLHAQELRTKHLGESNLDAIDHLIFVSPAGMKRARVRFGIPAEKCVVIGNTFAYGQFDNYRSSIDPKHLGFVGSVPQSKRLDLGLDILEGLNASDPGYRLTIKGKEYTDFPWIQSRARELEYFQQQYERISSSPALQANVTFGGHSADIARWYTSEPGFILSTSDHEGTHQAIAEGGAAGCVPVIFPWAGAEMVYSDRWMVDGVDDAIDRIRRLTADKQAFMEESFAVRKYVRDHFAPGRVGPQIVKIIEGGS